ncbi:MAG: SBBP repeat-containing protein [Promethearchaeota archaeon]
MRFLKKSKLMGGGFLFVTVAMMLGCSGSGAKTPVEPAKVETASPISLASTISAETNRYLWGAWEIQVAADHKSAEVITLREAEMHLNLVRMLETSPCTDCLVIDNFVVNPPGELSLDLTLKHPSDKLNLTGFDVRGIFISNADFLFPATGRSIAWSPDLPRILNADGYTTLFNPTEFPPDQLGPPVFKYIPGKYAPAGNPSATLNPFLAYGKANPRHMFLPGSEETRTIHLALPGGPFKFGYAVDACWAPPINKPVVDPETDFPANANCLEAYVIEIQVDEDLGITAGTSVPIQVEVFDHQGVETISTVSIEAPHLFSGELLLSFSEVTGEKSALYTGIIPNQDGAEPAQYPLLVKVVDTETDSNLGPIHAWNLYEVKVTPKGWAQTWGGSDEDFGFDIAVDNLGNSYITGYFKGTVDFDPGPGREVYTANGDGDTFLSKFNSNGEFEWTRTWGGSQDYEYENYDSGEGVAVDTLGNIYVTGYYWGFVDFDPGPGEDYHGSQDIDAFLSKFNSAGEFQWARTWGEEDDDYGCRVATDDLGNIYVTGSFSGTYEKPRSSFLSKYNSEGESEWIKIWSGKGYSQYCEGLAVTTDKVSNIYVTGYFEGTVDFDPSSGIDEHNSNGLYDVFLSKFDSTGHFHWARTWGGEDDYDENVGLGVATDNSNSIYVTGYFEGNADFDPGSGTEYHTSNGYRDIFLSKFNPGGDFQWARTWGGTEERDLGWAVAIDNSGYIQVTGSFARTVDFDPGAGVEERTAKGIWARSDIFLSRFNSTGQFQWVQTWGSELSDTGYGVTIDNSRNIYVTGEFGDTIDFDPGSGIDGHSSHGGEDVFLVKLPPEGWW